MEGLVGLVEMGDQFSGANAGQNSTGVGAPSGGGTAARITVSKQQGAGWVASTRSSFKGGMGRIC